MQSVSSRICSRVAVSISYDDNHYTTGTSTSVSEIYLGTAEFLALTQFLVEKSKIHTSHINIMKILSGSHRRKT